MYDSLGRTVKTQAKDTQGDVFVETHYDPMGRADRTTNPYRVGDGIYWSRTRYDKLGRAVETYAPIQESDLSSATSLGTTSYSISTIPNSLGMVVTATDASGRKSRSITNSLGQLVRVDEPTATGGTADADLGSLATPYQPTYYTYDAYGKMVRVNQGLQNRYFKYDSLGRLLRVNQPEQEVNAGLDIADGVNTGGHWTAGFAYDLLGNVVRATDANGVNIINEYDRASRVIKRCYTKPTVNTTATTCAQVPTNDLSADTPTVEFWYDGKGLAQEQSPNYAKGKLTKVTNGLSTTEYMTFDNFGRLTRSKQVTDGVEYGGGSDPNYWMTYAYNLSGALIEERYPSGRVVKNEFESDGDLSIVTSKKAGANIFVPYVSNFSYTASGGISGMRLGNGKWETAKFNERLQVTELGLGSSVTDNGLWKTNYEYGELDSDGIVISSKNTGNIARQTLTVPGTSFVQSYSYDSLYRLTQAQETTGTATNWTQQFEYDRYGNRIGTTQNIAGLDKNTTPTVDPNTNRFGAGQGFVYDKNGNVVADIDPATSQSRSFIFNGDNKQSEVRDANGNPVGRYYYDGEGKRVKKVTDQETTIFVYSGGKLVAEYSTELSQTPSVSYTTTDHLGSPRIITDATGQVISRRDFMPFGEDVFADVGPRTAALKYGSSTDDIRQKFTGYQKDSETSLDFAEARMYENRFGRFTAVDPLLASGKSANPQSFNRYIYAGNSPLVITDPSGLSWYKKKSGDRWNYQYSEDDKSFADGSSVDGWDTVDFGALSNNYLRLDDVCIASKCNSTRYIGRYGGISTPEEFTRQQDLGEFFATYSGIDPKQLGSRDPQMRQAAADVIGGITGAGINSVTGTYNLAAFGVNYFGGRDRLPYAWEYKPDSGGAAIFYYGTNAAVAVEGGISAYRSIASGINYIRSGGLSFSAYRTTQGSSEILGSIDVTTRSGRQIPYAIRTELSHMFISQAMQRKFNLPNWLVNNRINVWKLNTIQHALVDPYRFRTLPVGLKPQVGWRNTYTFFTRSF